MKCSYVVVVPLDNVAVPVFVPGRSCDARLSAEPYPGPAGATFTTDFGAREGSDPAVPTATPATSATTAATAPAATTKAATTVKKAKK